MENKDWREEIDEKFFEVSCECGARDLFDFSAVKSFIESLLKSKQEEIEKAMPEKKVSLIVMGFDGVTKKGVISEDGYEILCQEMEKRGYNQALQDIKETIDKLYSA